MTVSPTGSGPNQRALPALNANTCRMRSSKTAGAPANLPAASTISATLASATESEVNTLFTRSDAGVSACQFQDTCVHSLGEPHELDLVT